MALGDRDLLAWLAWTAWRAQLRLPDVDGLRVTVLASNTHGEELAQLEVTHPLRTRAKDCIAP